MVKLKGWLESNKVFFEVGAAILLAVMALILSWRGNQLADYQNRLTEAQIDPQFVFTWGTLEREQLGDVEVVAIENRGGSISNINVRKVSLAEIWAGPLSAGDYPKKLERRLGYVPIYYFSEAEFSNNSTGLLGKLYSLAVGGFRETGQKAHEGNQAEGYRRFSEELPSAFHSHGLRIVGVQLRHFFEIRYLDALGRQQVDFFEVRPRDTTESVWGSLPFVFKLTPIVGNEIFGFPASTASDFPSLSSSDAYPIWENVANLPSHLDPGINWAY